MKILLFGSNGQLASDLSKVCVAEGDTIVPVTHTQADICNEQSVAAIIAEAKPDVVVNTTAFHKVEECEKNPDLAFKVNGSAMMRLAVACKKAGALLVHFSTDYVFGGYSRSVPYEETDRTAPVNAYGISKAAGEHLIACNNDRYFIIRTCGLYGVAGSSGKGGNFVENILKKAIMGETIRVVDDQILTPTYTMDLAAAVRKLILTGNFGLYHLSSEGQCSWYEFTKYIFEKEGVAARVSAIKTDDMPQPVRRPNYSVLSKRKAGSLNISMPSWQSAICRYLEERKERRALASPVPTSVIATVPSV
jgi:dTDP-4-dehydrorhamnose reductase